MQTTFERAAGMSGKEYRHTLMVVQVRVAHRRTVKDQTVIEQRAVAVWGLLQLVQEIRNHADVIFVDRRELRDSLLILVVMRSSMESGRNTAFWESSSSRVATQ